MKLALLLFAGCNSWFGNDPVQGIDAKQYDAHLDAPTKCPMAGEPPPTFGVELVQDIVEPCIDYTFNSGRASASCQLPNGGRSVFEGAINDQLSRITAFDDGDQSTIYDEVALSSDAQTIYARHVDSDNGAATVWAARRQTDGTWQLLPAPALGQTQKDQLGTFAQGPSGDHGLIIDGFLMVHEWIEDADGWHEARVQSELTNVEAVTMTADGLRVVLHTLDNLDLYSDRPDIDSLFRTPVPFTTVPPFNAAAMLSEDCGRLYVTGLDSVFYVQQ